MRATMQTQQRASYLFLGSQSPFAFAGCRRDCQDSAWRIHRVGTNVCKMAYRKMIIKSYNDMQLAGYHINNGRFVMGESGGDDVNHPAAKI